MQRVLELDLKIYPYFKCKLYSKYIFFAKAHPYINYTNIVLASNNKYLIYFFRTMKIRPARTISVKYILMKKQVTILNTYHINIASTTYFQRHTIACTFSYVFSMIFKSSTFFKQTSVLLNSCHYQ